MAVPYTFGSATSAIPLSQLDSNFATAITLGNTAIQLGNTVTTLNNMTLANVTVSSGNVTVTTLTAPTINSGSSVALSLQSNGTTGIYMDTSQNVGIGTSSFAFSGAGRGDLEINGSTDSVIGLKSNGTSTGYFQATSSIFNVVAASVPMQIQSTGANYIASFTNGVERMRIDSSGNVGIGTTPSEKLTVYAASGYIANSLYSGTHNIRMYANGGDIGFQCTTSGDPMVFQTNGGSGSTERMRIDSSGNLLVGGSTVLNSARQTVYSSSGIVTVGRNTSATSGKYWNTPYIDGNNYLYIINQTNTGVYLSDGATAWTANSDERLKDIIEPITDAVNKVSTLRAVIGKYKTDEEGTRRSFLIAQDVQAVLPEAVSVGMEEMLGVQYTEVIPLLVAAIKEQQALITDMAAKLKSAGVAGF